MAKRLLSTQRIVNLAADPATGTAGEIYYNTVSNSFKYYDGSAWVAFSTGVPVGGTGGQILAKIDATNYNTEWIDNYTSQVKHNVKAAEAINKGQAVYVSSADGTNKIVSKASNSSESTSSKTLGLLEQNLSTNGIGFVVTEGLISGLNTSSANAGDPVWLGTNGNLLYGTANKPSAPIHTVFIGIVTRVQQNNGQIFVKVQNGYELDEIHNVSISSPLTGHTIVYNSTLGLWENKSIDLIPSQTGNSGKYLSTNGSVLSWEQIASAPINIGSSFPLSPQIGDFFFNYSDGILYLYFSGAWIEVGSTPPIDGGTSSTSTFSGTFDAGLSNSTYEFSIDGGDSNAGEVTLIA